MSTTQTLSFIFTLSTLWVNFLCCYLPSTYSAQAIVLQHNLLNKKCVLLDLAKFRQFGNISKVFANNFDVVLLVLGTILNTFWTKNSIWLIFIAVNGQILNKQYSHLVTLRCIPISGTWSPAVKSWPEKSSSKMFPSESARTKRRPRSASLATKE